MKGMNGIRNTRNFMAGLKTLTNIRIGYHKIPVDFNDLDKLPNAIRQWPKGTPLLSLGGIVLVKSSSHRPSMSLAFAGLEVIDFVGGYSLAEIEPSFTMGPMALPWGLLQDQANLPSHLGRRIFVRRARWLCYTVPGADIFWA